MSRYVEVKKRFKRLGSQNVIKVFKSLRKRSFYKAIEIASSIENTIERNEILQILYSAIVYSENNHYANLLKLCKVSLHFKHAMYNIDRVIINSGFGIFISISDDLELLFVVDIGLP